MHRLEDIDYHKARASHELDRGLTATDINAARSHLKLASMHMQRVRELGPPWVHEKPLLQM